MASELYPKASKELIDKQNTLAPDVQEAFQAFQQRVFTEGALSAKTKQLIAVAAAHVTQCPYCIKGHTRAAIRSGATEGECRPRCLAGGDKGVAGVGHELQRQHVKARSAATATAAAASCCATPGRARCWATSRRWSCSR